MRVVPAQQCWRLSGSDKSEMPDPTPARRAGGSGYHAEEALRPLPAPSFLKFSASIDVDRGFHSRSAGRYACQNLVIRGHGMGAAMAQPSVPSACLMPCGLRGLCRHVFLKVKLADRTGARLPPGPAGRRPRWPVSSGQWPKDASSLVLAGDGSTCIYPRSLLDRPTCGGASQRQVGHVEGVNFLSSCHRAQPSEE
jgi:hypothetical protein